ncbi:MAG TPA: SDR family oxidoreductase [Opitutaceae bacterium]|nr:SDR family oxidoreductase [Opitutaceae bacterium]
MRLQGKVALVTGAAQGIGLACAAALAREGAKVLVADLNATVGATALQQLRDAGAQAEFVACDVCRKADVEKAVAAAVAQFGQLDIAIANAGIVHAAEFLDLEEADFDRVLAVNLKGVFLVGQAAARRMVKQGKGGAIINMSSVNAVLAIPNQVPYVVSKGAVNQLTKVMALSLAPHGIRVNGIGPGTILTDLARKAVLGNRESERRILSRTPIGRMGEPDEIGKVAVFLASDDASYLTGQTIYPDGGRLALNYTVAVPE